MLVSDITEMAAARNKAHIIHIYTVLLSQSATAQVGNGNEKTGHVPYTNERQPDSVCIGTLFEQPNKQQTSISHNLFHMFTEKIEFLLSQSRPKTRLGHNYVVKRPGASWSQTLPSNWPYYRSHSQRNRIHNPTGTAHITDCSYWSDSLSFGSISSSTSGSPSFFLSSKYVSSSKHRSCDTYT